MSTVNQDSLTLDETNKVRVSLGLKPIGAEDVGEDGGEPPVDLEAIAEANFEERRQAMKRSKAEQELKEKMDRWVLCFRSADDRVKNQRALNAKLKGSTLGENEKDDSKSAKDWIKAQKKRATKRERELAERRAKEMEEADNVEYDERDLAGIKVGHDIDELEMGEDIVLTLKDGRILDGDEDELQNVNLVDVEKDKAVKERKRKAQAKYQGYDDDEFDENRIGKKAAVLDKYDDEFTGETVENEGFRLGAPMKKKAKMESIEEIERLGNEPAIKVKLDLNFAKDFEVSDYLQEGDKGFKVKKRRAKKSSRRREDDGEEDTKMDVDPNPTFARRVVGDGPDNLVDDDDLQAALARSRRQNAKKKPKATPEDLAARLALQRQEEAEVKQEEQADGEDGRITFDDTSEFVRNVTAESRAAPVKQERSRTRTLSPAAAGGEVVVKIERGEEGDGDAAMESDEEEEDDELAELAAREGLSLAEYRSRIDAQMTELSELKPEDAEDAPQNTSGMGMAGMLSMLRTQGTVQKESATERERQQRQHDLWLADHRRRAAQRELERLAARGENKDQAQREYDNRMREQQEAREAVEAFKHYKPDIEIAYHDEFGRKMTPKEAWKSLSHKFQYVLKWHCKESIC